MKILRDNMPFGHPGHGEFGTYFIGYSRSPRTIEQMLENMFIGRPAGNYDRLLDFSRAITGTLFFAPTTTFLESVDSSKIPKMSVPLASDSESKLCAPSIPPMPDGSLGIGTLRRRPQQ